MIQHNTNLPSPPTTHSFTEAHHRPQGAAEGAAAAYTATEQPLDVDGEGFTQHAIDSGDGGLELFRCYLNTGGERGRDRRKESQKRGERMELIMIFLHVLHGTICNISK